MLSSVALYPCRHWCVCMACAEALPSQQNTCPVCRQPFYLLLEYVKRSIRHVYDIIFLIILLFQL